MIYRLIVSAEAQDESNIATDYYDSINPILGDRFLQEIKIIFKKLVLHPQYYSFVSSSRKSNVRDVKLTSFPYVVVFEIRGNTVIVLSILNTLANK